MKRLSLLVTLFVVGDGMLLLERAYTRTSIEIIMLVDGIIIIAKGAFIFIAR